MVDLGAWFAGDRALPGDAADADGEDGKPSQDY